MPTLAKSEATIARILAAARDLFLAGSYGEVTTARIAKRAGVTKGAMYHHFASKEELYLALLFSDLKRKEELFRAAADSAGSARERLAHLTGAFFTLPRDTRRVITLIRRDINVFVDPVREELVRAYQRALPEQVERIVRDGIQAGELCAQDPRLLSWHFVALVETALRPYADTLFPNADAKLEHLLDLFFHGAGTVRAAQP
ncbi:MAG: TetR/AcrR family transcriptional regulator [Planctomycetota bacterium]